MVRRQRCHANGAACQMKDSDTFELYDLRVEVTAPPGGTILLARIRPGERLIPVRLAGLALAGASVALIAVAGAR